MNQFKLHFIQAIVIVLLANSTFGQSNLTVFSNEVQFILLVNGERKNTNPENNVKVEGISTDFVKLTFIVSDAANSEFTTSAMLEANDNATFELKKNKKGKYILGFVSGKASGNSDSSAPLGRPVTTVAKEAMPSSPSSEITNSTTTVTTEHKTTNESESVSASMTVNGSGTGLSMSIVVNDSPVKSQHTTTTSNISNTEVTSSSEISQATSSARPVNCEFSYLQFDDALATISKVRLSIHSYRWQNKL